MRVGGRIGVAVLFPSPLSPVVGDHEAAFSHGFAGRRFFCAGKNDSFLTMSEGAGDSFMGVFTGPI
jgi:hypothetical protein